LKKVILIFLISFCFAYVEAQNNPPSLVISSDEYAKLKKEHKLTGHEIIKHATSGTKGLTVTNPSKDAARLNNTNVVSTGCNCWIPRDGTFSVVPFSGYTPPLYQNDDGYTNGITLPFNFCLYGSTVGGAGNQMYINNNGNISFGASYSTFSAVAFPSATYTMVAPFWADVDTESPITDGGAVYYKLTPTYLIVQWDSVGVFDHTGQVNSFQLIITNGTDPILPPGNNISFCYGEMQWTTGDASGGTGGFGGTSTGAFPATVGLNKGDGVNYVQVSLFDTTGNTFTNAAGNPGSGVGWLVGQSFYFNGCSLTPTVTPSGITITTTSASCGGANGTASVTVTNYTGTPTYSWSPGGQTTPSITGLTPGSYTCVLGFATACAGTNTETLTTTVGQTGSTTVTVNSATICAGESATLTATGATTYSWNTGATTNTLTVSPNTTTSYTVVGTTGTCTNSAVSTVSVSPAPIITVNNATICVGNTGTLTATGAPSYTWSTGAITSTITVSPAVTTTYTVMGGVTTCTATATSTVVVNPLPTINAPPATICANQTATLCASGASTYTWNPGNITGACIVANPLVSTTYTVTGTNSFGCVSTGSFVSYCGLTVNIPITPTVTSNTPCANQTLTLTCTPTTYTNYAWGGPGLYTSTVPNPIRTGVTAADAGTYTLHVVDANGCTNIATIDVIVNPLPVVTANASPACLGQTINLSATGGFILYSWSGPSGYSSPLQNPSIPNVTNATAGQYEVTVTYSNTCTNTNIVNVSVYPLPIITITSPPSICISSTGTLITSGALDYVWNPATDLNATFGNQVLITPTSTAIHTYTVTGQNINGCINTATTSIVVNGLPAVSIAPDTTKGCIPQCLTYTVNSPSAAKYTWSFGNGQTATFVAPNNIATMCYTITGNYRVILTLMDINGCVNTATASVIAYPIPNPEFVYTPNPATILAPTVQFLNQSSGAIIKSYNWNFGDASGTGSTLYNPIYTYADTGTYYVTLTDTSINGCSASIVQPIIIEQDFTLYVPSAFSPNGDGKNEFFKAQGDGVLTFTMYIFDRWGNPIFTSNDINTGWNGRRNNNSGTEALQEDVYVWKIEATGFQNVARNLHGTVTLVK